MSSVLTFPLDKQFQEVVNSKTRKEQNVTRKVFDGYTKLSTGRDGYTESLEERTPSEATTLRDRPVSLAFLSEDLHFL